MRPLLRVKRCAIRLASLAATLCVLSGTAAAQVASSTIQGTVSDDTGMLPGATVTAQELESGFTP
jgi:hypothetical protein